MVEEILGELDGNGMYAQLGIVLVIGVVVSVHVREEASEKYEVSVGEWFDVVPCEAGSCTFDDVDDFVFVVEVPGILEVVVVAPFDFDRGTAGQSQLFVHDVNFVFHKQQGVLISGLNANILIEKEKNALVSERIVLKL